MRAKSVMPKIAVLGVLVLMLSGAVFMAGCVQRATPKMGLVGYWVSVPIAYRVNYQSLDVGEALTDPHDERITIRPVVSDTAIIGRPVYASDFADLAKNWLGQRIPTLENQQGISDDAFLMEDQDPAPDKDFTNYGGSFSDDEGWPVYCGGRWTFTFTTADGSVLYTKTVRNMVLLRILPAASGTTETVHTCTVGVYIPTWRMPDDSSGPMVIKCQLDYELQSYAVGQLKHVWSQNQIFDKVLSKLKTLIRSGIEALANRIDEFIQGVGDFYIRAVVEPIWNITSSIIPVNVAQMVGLATKSLKFFAHTTTDEVTKLLDMQGYSNPNFVAGTGSLTIQIQIQPTGNEAIIYAKPEGC